MEMHLQGIAPILIDIIRCTCIILFFSKVLWTLTHDHSLHPVALMSDDSTWVGGWEALALRPPSAQDLYVVFE